MRIVFINLHCNGLIVRNLEAIISGRRVPCRHRFILDALLKQNIEIIDFVTLKGTYLPPRPKWLRGNFHDIKWRVREARFVFRCNHISGIKIIADEEKLSLQNDDIVMYYSHMFEQGVEQCIHTNAIRIVDLTHFYGLHTTSLLLQRGGVECFVSETNLKKYSLLFQKNYGWYQKDVLIRPFNFENRFVPKIEFDSRKNRACAMGSVAWLRSDTNIHYEYICEYHTRYMQPSRKKIYEHADELIEFMDCYSYLTSDYQKNDILHIKAGDLLIKREYKWWYNYFLLNRFPKYYRAFNMVDKLNEYKIVINGEDANGIYAIGAIEAMACGCAFIGRNYGAYEDLGLEDGVSYIAYDGSISDLKVKLKYYLDSSHQDELKKIAMNGCEHVRKNFSEAVVAQRYIQDLFQIRESRMRGEQVL